MQMFTEILALFVFVLLFVAFLLNAVHLWSQLHFKAEPLQQAESRDTLVLLLFVCVRVCVCTHLILKSFTVCLLLCVNTNINWCALLSMMMSSLRDTRLVFKIRMNAWWRNFQKRVNVLHCNKIWPCTKVQTAFGFYWTQPRGPFNCKINKSTNTPSSKDIFLIYLNILKLIKTLASLIQYVE